MKILSVITKYSWVGTFSSLGLIISNLLGGWDVPIQTLLFFMAIDYITGLLCAISGKSEKGSLNSQVGWKGLVKKGVALLIVMCAYRIDTMASIDYARNWTILSFTLVEFISITENSGLLGVKVPSFLVRIIEVLKNKQEEENKEDES